MQQKLNFKNKNELSAWLVNQPTQWSQVIAWRIAMRVTPVLGRIAVANSPQNLKQDLLFRTYLFKTYHCLLISSVARNSPTDNIKAAARAAARAAADAAAAAADFADTAADAAARAAARAAVYAGDAAGDAAAAAADAADAAADASATMWRAVAADADFLQNGGEPNGLAVQSLWWGAPPEKFAELWRAHKQASPDFAPWQAWWEAATGWGGQAPHDYFGEELSKRIALQPKEWWNRGVEAVNGDIVQWLNERGPLSESPARPIGQAPAGEPFFPPADHRPHYADDGIERDANGVPVDHLGVRQEARIFARLLAGQETKLPLAIGLFGPWGGGKSFFMESIRAEMAALAKDKAPGYHHAVAHITFNAWHYVDADLWASLGLRIFEGVTEHLGGERKSGVESERLELGKKISSNQRIKTESESAIKTAKERREEAVKELEVQQKQHREQTDGDLLTAVKKAAGDTWPGDLKKIAETVGVATPQQLKDIEATLQEAVRTKEKFEKYLPKSLRAAALESDYFIPAGMIAAALIIAAFDPAGRAFFDDAVKLIAGGAGALFAAVAGWSVKVAPMLKKAQEAAGKAEEYKQRFDAAREAQRPSEPDAKKLAEIDSEIATLKSKIAAADKEIMAAEARLLAVDSGMLIYDHLTERVKDARYVDRQGVVAVLRRDLEDLKRYLDGQTQEKAKVQRIVLYIDDLDRCEPARVVEVLQAVHLLLAFPLFAVIVAVDPRWLERSLYDKYVPGHLTMAREELAKVNFTPRNYLEKIFQIPYRLKPMDDAFGGLVDGLTKGLLELPAAAKPAEISPSSRPILVQPGGDTILTQTGDPLIISTGADEAPNAQQEPSPPPPPPPPAPPPPPERKPPEPLKLTPDEASALKAMQPLVPTPRALKRLLNIYLLTRLQRAEASAAPGVVMTLLGLEMGFPVAGKKLLEKIRGEGEAGAAPLTGLAEKIEAPEAGRLIAALQKVAPEVTVKDVYDWLEFAERFSFDPPPAGPA
jgi:hypothetical protein